MVRRTETDETRQRLLNRLGYFKHSQQLSPDGKNAAPFSSLERRGSTASLDSIGRIALRSATSFQQELQSDSTTTSKIASDQNKHPSTTKVKFCQIVSGLEIPSRYQYSDRIKRTIWADRTEINEMVERNIQEFEAEGFDWKNVVLDDDMYVNEVNGELIHPCHYCDQNNSHFQGNQVEDEPYFPPLRRHNSVI